ncbi:hypothetical protein MWU50_07380 [Flavobacteriaceae bacterium S0862]|nr:hypothetical protein [Flavobacteriaceae bacterium S0862]
MKFTNAYELNLLLYQKGLIDGLHLGIRGDYEIETKINDENLLNLLNKIWGAWRWDETEGEANATYGGFYDLYLDSNNELSMDVSINDDILDFNGNPFDIEKILGIISKYLSLDCVDQDEFLEYQICLDLELDYESLKEAIYQSPIFSIKSYENDTQLKLELLNKIKEQDIDKIKELVVDYLVLVHKEEHESYEGFSLTIEDNYFSNYTGTGHEKVKGLRTFLESQLLEIDIDLTNIAIANKT